MREFSLDNEKASSRITDFIQFNMEKFERDGVILGMSGGVDSSLVASLAVKALGSKKVLALLLPERDSSPESKTDALIEIKRLGIEYREIKLTPLLKKLGIYHLVPLRILGLRTIKESVVKKQHEKQKNKIGEMSFKAGLLGTSKITESKELINTGNAYSRVKHRLRLLILYYYADLENRLVLGTTNKSESMTGFVVKWGDNVADIEPILPLYKTQVWQLASYMGVTQKIIEKSPTPDLMPGINDEFALGIDYKSLDRVLIGIEKGWDNQQLSSEFSLDEDLIQHVRELVDRSKHLRQFPPSPIL
jgi:NAD+ synthase